MDVQVLVSTMNQKDYSIIDRMNIQSDAIIVNQCGENERTLFTRNGKKILWINSTTKGLSISRNIALEAATGDICLLADDDLIYREGYPDMIRKCFCDIPNYSIIRFRVEGIEKSFKRYPDKDIEINKRQAMKVSSVELAFKRKDVQGIFFDEAIGAGTKFKMGEENAFLMECLRSHLKIRYVNKTISDLHIGESSWFDGYNKGYLYGRGAAITALKTGYSPLLILAFGIMKYPLYKSNASFVEAIREMNRGRKDYYLEKK